MYKWALFLLLMLIFANSSAGVLVTTTQSEGKVTHIYQDDQMVMLIDGKTQMIIDAKKDLCITLNHRAKKYLRMSCKKLKQSTKSMMSGMGDMAKQMQDMMPPDVQAQMQAMHRMPPLKVKKTGAGKYAGFSIVKYKILAGSDTIAEYWLSPKVSNLIQKEVNYEKYRDLLLNDEEFQQGPMAQMMGKLMKKEAELYKKGFVLKQMSYVNNGPNAPPEIISSTVAKKTVNIKKYYPPAAYKQVKSLQQLMF